MWIKSGFFLLCVVAVASLGHAAQDDTKPPAWQVEGFWAALNDENLDVIRIAIDHKNFAQIFAALGKKRAEDQIRYFTKMLNSPETISKKLALTGLVNSGMATINLIPQLIELLHNPDDNVRMSAARALKVIRLTAKEQISELYKLLRDPDSNVRGAAASVLMAMDAAPKEPILELIRAYPKNK
ncbi:MAG: HEAT repeat domain-containing protein [Candidatus Competibacter sp.]